MSLLSIVAQVANRVIGTPASSITTAAGSADQNIQQIISLVNEDGQELGARASWQNLRKEAAFSTVGVAGGILTLGTLTGGAGYASGLTSTYSLVPLTGGSGSGAVATVQVTSGVVSGVTINANSQGSGYAVNDVLSANASSLGGTGAGFSIPVATIGVVGQVSQGSLLTLAGADFAWIVNETAWDRTTRRPLFGPKSPAEWQQLQAQLMQGPYYQYTIRGNNLLMLPAPSPGDQIYFEWMSKYWCASSTGTGQTFMVADTDVTNLPDERLHVLGAVWRFNKAKGFAWQEDEQKYEAAVMDAMTRDGAKPKLDLAGGQANIYPGIIVPAGNWPISGSPNGA